MSLAHVITALDSRAALGLTAIMCEIRLSILYNLMNGLGLQEESGGRSNIWRCDLR